MFISDKQKAYHYCPNVTNINILFGDLQSFFFASSFLTTVFNLFQLI